MTLPASTAVDYPDPDIRRGLAQRSYSAFVGLEVLAFAGATLFLLVMLREALFLGQTTMTHDTVLWVYPIFTYLADGILHGHLPLWNPFSRGGEPLLPSYLQTRLLDPIDYLTVYVGSLFTQDLTTLFNWDRVVRLLAGALGTHLLLRRWARHPATRMALAIISVMSSMTLNIFHQCGFNDQYYCAPFVTLFVFRVLEGRGGWADWMGVVFFLGCSLQSYFFVGTVLLVLTIVLGYALFLPAQLVDLLRSPSTWTRLALSLFLLALMLGPSLALFERQNEFHMSARSYPEQWRDKSEPSGSVAAGNNLDEIKKSLVIMPYRFIRLTGTPVRPADLLGLLGPQTNDTKRDNGTNWLTRVEHGAITSDARLFIGSFAFALSLIGIAFGHAVRKRIWLLILGVFGLLMLGPYTPLHELLYQVLPPLWIIRHTQQLANFFLLALVFFFVLGSDYLLTLHHRWKHSIPKRDESAKDGPLTLNSAPPVFARPLFVTALLLVTDLVLNLLREDHLSLTMSLFSNPLLNCLYVLAIIQFCLAGLEWACTHSPWPHDRLVATGPGTGLLRNNILTGCMAVAIGFALSTYLLGNLSDLFSVVKFDLLVNFLSLLAIAVCAYGIFRHCLAIRWSFRLSLPIASELRWQVSTSNLYARCVRIASENRFELQLCLLAACLVLAFVADGLAYDIGRLLDLLRAQLTTVYGKHLSRWTYVLAGLVVLLAFLSFATRERRLEGAPGSTPVKIQKVAAVACLIAVLVVAMMPSPDTGLGAEDIARGPFGLPRSVSFPPVMALLGTGCLALAASIFGKRFVFILFLAMTVAASLVFMRPFALLTHLALFVFVPFAGLIMLRLYRPRYFRQCAAAWLLLATATELGKLAVEFRPEVEVPRHTIKRDWPVAAGSPAFPETRVAAIPAPPYSIDSDQPLRFPELLTRTGTALTTPADYPLQEFVPETAYVLEKKHANTFFTLESYEYLLQAKLPADVMDAIFAIGAPIFQFKTNGQASNNFLKSIDNLSAAQRIETLQSTVFLDPAKLPPSWSPPPATNREPAAHVNVLSLDYDRAAAVVDTSAPGFLYFADSFTDDWIATVNGAAVPVLRANVNFKAVQVGPGESIVEFSYKPASLLWALRLFFGSLAFAFFFALGSAFLSRNRKII